MKSKIILLVITILLILNPLLIACQTSQPKPEFVQEKAESNPLASNSCQPDAETILHELEYTNQAKEFEGKNILPPPGQNLKDYPENLEKATGKQLYEGLLFSLMEADAYNISWQADVKFELKEAAAQSQKIRENQKINAKVIKEFVKQNIKQEDIKPWILKMFKIWYHFNNELGLGEWWGE